MDEQGRGVRVVAGYKVDACGHEPGNEMHVSSQAIQFGNHEPCARETGMGNCILEGGPIL